MSESGLAAVTRFVMRDQQHLGLLRVRDGVITLEQLYFADEIRPIDEIKPEKASVKKEELEMASQLIESYTSEWDPKKYKDTYRDELMAVIRGEAEGQAGARRAGGRRGRRASGSPDGASRKRRACRRRQAYVDAQAHELRRSA